MKKILLNIALLSSVFTFAQIDLGSVRYGITGGLNYSRVRHAHNPSGPRFAFNAGALAIIPISKDDQFYLQPEILYHGAGESGKDKNQKSHPDYNAIYANNYLSVPIYFKAYFSEAESEFFAIFGPKFNFLLNQKIKTTNPDYTVEGQGDVNGKAASLNFALSGGIGFSYKRKLEITCSYDKGFSNTYKGLMNEVRGVDQKKSEQVLSVGLNYIFD